MLNTIKIRKKWKNEDINELLEMKKARTPLKKIGIFFNVTPNAISKALQRYCSDYTHPQKRLLENLDCEEYDIQHIDAALRWAKGEGILISRDMSGVVKYNGMSVSEKFAILQINRYRINKGIPILKIKYWSVSEK